MKRYIRWWIDTYTDANYVTDRVHRILYKAFGEAGIELSLDAYDLNVSMIDPNLNSYLGNLTVNC